MNILERFKGPLTEWDLSENLLVDGDRVICTPGGENAVMAALDQKTGDTVWVTTGLTDMTSYCGPALVTHNGRRILLTMTSKFVICVDADAGALLWKHPHPTDWDVHPNTPLYHNGCVYYVAGYKSGGGLLELSPTRRLSPSAGPTRSWTASTTGWSWPTARFSAPRTTGRADASSASTGRQARCSGTTRPSARPTCSWPTA